MTKTDSHDPGEPGTAGDCEIEVTPEMIKVGVAELTSFNSDLQSWEEGAERIYLAMASVAPRQRSM